MLQNFIGYFLTCAVNRERTSFFFYITLCETQSGSLFPDSLCRKPSTGTEGIVVQLRNAWNCGKKVRICRVCFFCLPDEEGEHLRCGHAGHQF